MAIKMSVCLEPVYKGIVCTVATSSTGGRFYCHVLFKTSFLESSLKAIFIMRPACWVHRVAESQRQRCKQTGKISSPVC